VKEVVIEVDTSLGEAAPHVATLIADSTPVSWKLQAALELTMCDSIRPSFKRQVLPVYLSHLATNSGDVVHHGALSWYEILEPLLSHVQCNHPVTTESGHDF
jgi:hypothetical protein